MCDLRENIMRLFSCLSQYNINVETNFMDNKNKWIKIVIKHRKKLKYYLHCPIMIESFDDFTHIKKNYMYK